MEVNVDDLAQEIRRVDGSNSLGAGALAEALLPFIEAAFAASQDTAASAVRVKDLIWEIDELNWWVAQPPVMINGEGYEVRITDRGKTRIRRGSGDWHDFDGSADEAKEAFQADYERRIRSALAAPVPQATEGWKLVPVEPTEEMIDAGADAQTEAKDEQISKNAARNLTPFGAVAPLHYLPQTWRAMLAAAPTPKAEGEQV